MAGVCGGLVHSSIGQVRTQGSDGQFYEVLLLFFFLHLGDRQPGSQSYQVSSRCRSLQSPEESVAEVICTRQLPEAISNLPLSGDMKPSKLMSNMLALLPAGHEPCFFLKGAFLKRLPTDIRAHLLRDDFSDPISFALKADELYQSRVSSSQVYSVSSTPEDQQSVNAIRPSVPNRSRRSAAPHASSRHDSRSQSPTMCYYHRSWGSKAKKCRAPCSWLEN